MLKRKGFTLIELMVVIVIVAILAAVVVPLLLSRVERSKYSEGKAIASQVATALRAYVAEYGVGTNVLSSATGPSLGFQSAELDGKYFAQSGIAISNISINTDGTLNYQIVLTPRTGMGLNSGVLTMVCTSNVTNFTTPSGI